MKQIKQSYFYILGLLIMSLAYYGHVSNLDCSTDVVWPTYVYLIGAAIVGIGLYLHFRKNTKSAIKASIFSLLFVVAILIAGSFLAVASQPDGIFHCYEL